jgi:hypothetical protein
VPVAAWIALMVLTPVLVGVLAGAYVRPGSGYRESAGLAWICSFAIAAIVFVIGVVTAPPGECGNNDCDTSYGLGALLIAIVGFAPTMLGVTLGRRVARRWRSG